MFRRSVLSFEHDVTMNPWSLRNISLMLFFLWCREILHSLASFSQMTKWQKEFVGGLPKLGANGSFPMCSQLDSDVVPTSYPISISPLVFYLANPSPFPHPTQQSTFGFPHLFSSPALESSKEFHLLGVSNRPIKMGERGGGKEEE